MTTWHRDAFHITGLILAFGGNPTVTFRLMRMMVVMIMMTITAIKLTIATMIIMKIPMMTMIMTKTMAMAIAMAMANGNDNNNNDNDNDDDNNNNNNNVNGDNNNNNDNNDDNNDDDTNINDDNTTNYNTNTNTNSNTNTNTITNNNDIDNNNDNNDNKNKNKNKNNHNHNHNHNHKDCCCCGGDDDSDDDYGCWDGGGSSTGVKSWWRHQINIFSALLALCVGNSPVIGEFPSQRPVRRSFGVLFDLCLNIRLIQQPWRRCFETPSRSLWRHCNVVMENSLKWSLGCDMIIYYWPMGPCRDGCCLTTPVVTGTEYIRHIWWPWGSKNSSVFTNDKLIKHGRKSAA